MPDAYIPEPDDPVAGPPVVFQPGTFDRHTRAVEMVEGANQAVYPRAGRGRTTSASSGTWGYLASGASISGAAGLVLGSGNVTLCTRSGGSLVADGDVVPVLNSGGTITGAQCLELAWTDGAWSVCQCGATPAPGCLFCLPCQLPTKDLGYSFSGDDPYAPFSGSGTLVFNGTDSWTSAPFAGGYVIDVHCVGNQVTPRILLGGVSLCTFGAPTATSCNPLALGYAVPAGSAASSAGFDVIQVADPGPGLTPCPVPCDCTNCVDLCGGGVILLVGQGTVTDDNGTRSVEVGIGGCNDLITSAPLPFVDNEVVDCDPRCDIILDPDNPPICTDVVEGSRTTQYSLCFRCPLNAGQPATITLVSYTIGGVNRCHDVARTICGYTGLFSSVTRNAVITCSGGQLTATADFSDLGVTGDCSVPVPPVITNVTYRFPLGPTNAMCQSFGALGCGNLGTGIAGATVSVYDRQGGTLLGSWTTNSGGGIPTVYFENTGNPFWITVDPADDRFAGIAGSHTLACNGSTSLVLPVSGNYVCTSLCGAPLAKTLHATHPTFGALTLVYNATGSLGAGWYATVSYNYTGCRCCPAKTVTVTCYMDTNGVFSDHWKSL